MKNPFWEWWLSIEWILHIIEYEKDIIKFLLDIRSDYRIQRAMWPDEWDKLLNWTYVIDDIISRIPKLEEARAEYFEKKKQQEEEKREKELEKQDI